MRFEDLQRSKRFSNGGFERERLEKTWGEGEGERESVQVHLLFLLLKAVMRDEVKGTKQKHF